MGLFSFIKNAGQKLFKRKATPEAEELSPEAQMISDLTAEISRLGIPVSGLTVDLGTQVHVGGTTETNADREKLILALGNVEGVSCVDDNIEVSNPEPESVFHTVEEGDTLSKISKTVYGDPMKYNTIFEANKPMLDHPDKIYPGQILRIPPLG